MRVVLSGYYGMGNGGDEALLASLLQNLPATVTPVVLSGNPFETEKRYGVATCRRKSLREVVRAIYQADGLVWGGGSLMQDATSLASPFYYAGLMMLAQRLGKITIAWAQGIGPLHHAVTRWLARQTFRYCTAVSVRDDASARLLTEWKIPCTLAPDPVWAMTASPVPGFANLPAPRVAVVLRPSPQLTSSRLAAITQALKWFQDSTQTYVLLIPFQPSKDMEIAQHIHTQLPEVSQILCLDDPRMLKGVFQGVEMTIAMRLHGVIMAAAEGSRCFALSYDPKVEHLMTALNLPGWNLEHLPESPSQICQAWLECYANSDALMPEQIQGLVDRALIHRDLLHQHLCSSSLHSK
ncbi:MAG: polysaccharide pyruvyl transferase CsaB [Cyanobacteria bacterium]|nr:polysaccharide pyruvyl transferase CsaB [Cyanobacteriota bacterium]MDW8202709.1 polysaccharide pyruvyl transferase CsaB [Cyanobacteriota bacterium SKYGB_h_bin112]